MQVYWEAAFGKLPGPMGTKREERRKRERRERERQRFFSWCRVPF